MTISGTLENMPVRQKLVLMVMTILTIMLFLVTGMVIIRSIYTETAALKERAATGAQVIAQMTATALLYDDRDMAAQRLSALEFAASVSAVCLYQEDSGGRRLFSSYYIVAEAPPVVCRETLTRPEGEVAGNIAHREFGETIPFYRDGGLLVFDRPVMHAGQEIGVLRMYFHTADLQRNIWEICLFMAVLFLITLGLTYILTSYLQCMITRPVLKLSSMARHFTDREFVMAELTTADMQRKDEIGVLFRSFQAMTGQIEKREESLQEAVRFAEEAQKTAEQANNMKSLFLANMSHELRTPLNGMIGMADLLASGDLETEQRQQVQMISESGQTLLSLMNDILDFSKIEAGEIDLKPERVEVRKLVKNVLTQSAYAAGGVGGPDLLLKIAPALPDFIEADPVRLRQILTNLVCNAVKFTEEGYVMLRADILSPPDSKTGKAVLLFSVEDTGIGIPPEKHDYIFEKFARIKSGNQPGKAGSGLGLAICKQLVHMMGGDIRVDSTPGQGSVFSFRLTVPAYDAKEKEGGQAEEDMTDMTDMARSRTVMLVSRKGPFRDIVCGYMQALGIDYCHAGSLLGALRRMRREKGQGRYDLVLIDSKAVSPHEYRIMSKLVQRRQDDGNAPARIAFLGRVYDPDNGTALYRTLSLPLPFDDRDFRYFIGRQMTAAWNGLPAPKEKSVLKKRVRGDFEQAILAGLSVLVADDDRISQKVIEKMLENLGCRVTMVSDGKQAVDLWREEDFDVILMDCMMPVMDGYTATRKIRSREKKQAGSDAHRTVVIAMTANAMPGDKEKCMKGGMDDYLLKPIRKKDVYDILKRNLKHIRRRVA